MCTSRTDDGTEFVVEEGFCNTLALCLSVVVLASSFPMIIILILSAQHGSPIQCVYSYVYRNQSRRQTEYRDKL